VNLAAQAALDFAEIVAEVGVDCVVGETSLRGLLTGAEYATALAPGGYEERVDARLRLLGGALAQQPVPGDKITAGGVQYRVLAVKAPPSYPVIALELGAV
jgi:hypothetical protein